MSGVVELLGVSKRFGEHPALYPLDLTVPPQETLVLLGESGSGKSTLLRLIAGLDLPSTGTVRVDGQLLDPRTAEAHRRKLGYGVQGGGLFPHLSAEQNVALLARHLGWAPERLEARIEELCALTRMPREMLKRFPLQLSGGQVQRVSLIRALMLDPELLLLDEPLGALDPITRHELQADLKDIFVRLKKTVVLVTHDLGEAAFLGQHVVLLRDGQVVQRGTLTELFESPADDFVRRFIHAQRSPLESFMGPR